MDDKRAGKRWRAVDYSMGRKKIPGKKFGVYDRTSDDFVGYLEDISSEGMMILSPRALPEGTTLKLIIELPEEIKGSDRLIVEAKSVWIERDVDSDFNKIGFAFTLTFPHHNEIIELLFQGKGSIDIESPKKTSPNPN
jgi:hypothetical protein